MESEQKHTPQEGLTILVVDDEPFTQAMHVRMIKSHGPHVVLQASCAKDALCLLKDTETQIDLILSDLAMPDMDGLEMLKQAASSTHARPKVVFISQMAQAMGQAAELIVQSEGFTVLPTEAKPLTSARLSAILRAL